MKISDEDKTLKGYVKNKKIYYITYRKVINSFRLSIRNNVSYMTLKKSLQILSKYYSIWNFYPAKRFIEK